LMKVEQQEVQIAVVKKLFDDRLCIELPENTIEMPDNLVRRFYPFQKRPHHIFYQEEHSLHFTFSLLDKELGEKQIAEAIFESRQVIDSAHPQSIVEQIDFVHNASGDQYGWFAFKPPSLGEKRYNMIYIMSVNNRFMHGTCSCLFKSEENRRKIKQIPLLSRVMGRGGVNVRSDLY